MPDQQQPYSKIGPDAEFIGAGDTVVILDDDFALGVLVDVEGTEACVRLADGSDSLTYCDFDRLAHPDSPQAEAFAAFGDPRKD